MIFQCDKCGMYFEDIYRSTICPHKAFPANDGKNNFKAHEDSYLSDEPPDKNAKLSHIDFSPGGE